MPDFALKYRCRHCGAFFVRRLLRAHELEDTPFERAAKGTHLTWPHECNSLWQGVADLLGWSAATEG